MIKKLFLAAVIFSFISCTSNDTKKSVSTEIPNENTTQTDSLSSDDLFEQPAKLINVLSENGIGKLSNWENPKALGWFAQSPFYSFGSKENEAGLRNNISYTLDGSEKMVDQITINLNINNPAEKKKALQYLNETAQKTFTSIRIPMPPGLSDAILNSKAIVANSDMYTISCEIEKNNIERTQVVIRRK